MPEKGVKSRQQSSIVEKKNDTDFMDIDSLLNMMMLMVVMSLAVTISPMAQNVNSYVQSQSYQGIQQPLELTADPTLRIYNLNNAWSAAAIYNRGPYPVKVGANSAAEMFTIESGQSYNITRLGARYRISSIYYQCLTGQYANIRITGEY